MKEKYQIRMEAVMVMKYVCKLCEKKFPCGRSLGGHMRSHFTNNTSHRHHSFPNYSLRDTPNKSLRLDHHQSMDSHESHTNNNNNNNNGVVMMKKKRKRSQRATRYLLASDSCEQEQQEVAMCLIMLSRDVTHWSGLRLDSVADSSDNFSKKPCPKTSSSEDLRSDRAKDFEKQEIVVGSLGSRKRTKSFKCGTCSKTFHSYQALGGHRASHKKSTKTCSVNNAQSENSIAESIDQYCCDVDDDEDEEENSKKAEKQVSVISSTKLGHECPICQKVFPSGQALGGHKRSHLLIKQRTKSVSVENPAPKIRDLLDLNLPAPDNDDEQLHNNSELNPWWFQTTHNHDPLVGLIS